MKPRYLHDNLFRMHSGDECVKSAVFFANLLKCAVPPLQLFSVQVMQWIIKQAIVQTFTVLEYSRKAWALRTYVQHSSPDRTIKWTMYRWVCARLVAARNNISTHYAAKRSCIRVFQGCRTTSITICSAIDDAAAIWHFIRHKIQSPLNVTAMTRFAHLLPLICAVRRVNFIYLTASKTLCTRWSKIVDAPMQTSFADYCNRWHELRANISSMQTHPECRYENETDVKTKQKNPPERKASWTTNRTWILC